jgi:hypothetical protein
MHDPANLDSAARNVDYKEDVVANKPVQREHFDREEIASCYRAPVRPKEFVPGHPSFAFGRKLDALLLQYYLDGRSPDIEAKAAQYIAPRAFPRRCAPQSRIRV